MGNDVGQNLATVIVGERKVFEVSRTAGPRGYLNPVLPVDLNKLSSSKSDGMAR